MAVLPVKLIAPTFPEGYCPPNAQQFANDLLDGAIISSSLALESILIQDTPPGDHSKLWFKTSAGAPYAYPTIPIYFWHPGLVQWVARHPDSPGDQKWQEFANEAAIWSYQGGDGQDPSIFTPTLVAGTFWEVDPRYLGRSPMSPGAIAGSNPAKTLGYQENFGEGAHTQGVEEVGPHTHPLNSESSIENADGSIKVVPSGSGADTGLLIGGSGVAVTALSVLANAYVATQQAGNVTHPVRGQSCIRRTGRIWYLG